MCYEFPISNKKVLLRERKRHTDHDVSSTPSVTRGGVPPIRVPPLGYPPARSDGGVPPCQGTPWPGPMGVGVPKVGYPPCRGTPQAGPGQGTPHFGYPPGWTWPRYPPPKVWTDRRMDGWTDTCQKITFPRTTYAVGNKDSSTQ